MCYFNASATFSLISSIGTMAVSISVINPLPASFPLSFDVNHLIAFTAFLSLSDGARFSGSVKMNLHSLAGVE